MYDFSFDGDPRFRRFIGSQCRQEHERSTAFMLNRGRPFAAYVIDWHSEDAVATPAIRARVGHGRDRGADHAGPNRANLCITTGDFREPEYRTQVTIHLQLTRVSQARGSLLRLVEVVPSTLPVHGRTLSVDEAKDHPRLGPTLAAADWLARNDAVVRVKWGVLSRRLPELA